MRAAVAEQFLAFGAKKAPRDRDDVIALLEHEAAGDQARAPLVVIRAALSAKGIDVFLRDPVNDRADSGPHARPGTHGAGLVGGVEDKVGQVAPISAGYVLERFQLHVLDARSGGLHAVARAGDNHFAAPNQPGDDRADRIVAAITGALGFRDRQLHKLPARLVGSGDGNHTNRLYVLGVEPGLCGDALERWRPIQDRVTSDA